VIIAASLRRLALVAAEKDVALVVAHRGVRFDEMPR
jgi:hypothetical protein